jgi:hypothetical protein
MAANHDEGAPIAGGNEVHAARGATVFLQGQVSHILDVPRGSRRVGASAGLSPPRFADPKYSITLFTPRPFSGYGAVSLFPAVSASLYTYGYSYGPKPRSPRGLTEGAWALGPLKPKAMAAYRY